MNAKKESKNRLEKKKITFILIGLVTALSLVYVAFEWTNKNITIYTIDTDTDLKFEPDNIIQTTQKEETPPPPKKEVEIIEQINIIDDDEEIEGYEFDNSDDDMDQAQEIIDKPIEVLGDEEDEKLEQVFEIVEEMPEPPGGIAALMKYFGKHVRYPIVAQENNIQGRVTCQFTVFKDGSIGDIKVVRGVHPSLDKEAIRLLSTMPKWKPGMQQGRAVNCKYTIPVVFKLK